MTRVRLRYQVEATQVTVDNLAEVAAWMDGTVVGVRLLPKDRAVRFTNRDHWEQDANVGTWIVRFELVEGRRHGFVLSPMVFEAMFVQEVSDGPK
jgi:hypothetical protein